MPSKTLELYQRHLLHQIPADLPSAVQYEVVLGSLAYGVEQNTSDMDVYGFFMPRRAQVFPHEHGYITGFDDPPAVPEQWQQHRVMDAQALGGAGRQYDLTLYSVIKYFKLLSLCNPNIIDSLFAPAHCILHESEIGKRLRQQRKIFLHKGCWATFKGYAYRQLHKLKTKQPEGKRQALVEQFGYDVKFAYHIVRLLDECEQLLVEQDLHLAQNAEQLKSVRRGEWSLEQLENYFREKERLLEQAYIQSQLPAQPDLSAIKTLLLEVLETYYGSATRAQQEGVGLAEAKAALAQIQVILDGVKQS